MFLASISEKKGDRGAENETVPVLGGEQVTGRTGKGQRRVAEAAGEGVGQGQREFAVEVV